MKIIFPETFVKQDKEKEALRELCVELGIELEHTHLPVNEKRFIVGKEVYFITDYILRKGTVTDIKSVEYRLGDYEAIIHVVIKDEYGAEHNVPPQFCSHDNNECHIGFTEEHVREIIKEDIKSIIDTLKKQMIRRAKEIQDYRKVYGL